MPNKLVVANLKMNMTKEETEEFIEKVEDLKDKVVICPTSIYIPFFIENEYHVGSQNVFYEAKGAYTGEVSPKQLRSLNVEYTIIGHSERRSIMNETDEDINRKIKESLKYNLKVILCIGETLEQKKASITSSILENQLLKALKDINSFENVIIAYEPVWSIGTGLVMENTEIKETVDYIKQIYDVPILYGGSVSDKNIESLNQIPNLSGYLVGGASLYPDKLSRIIEVAVS